MNLKVLIKQGESETLELKETLQLKDEIGETVSAFSNLKGGVILVGVSDKGGVKGIQIGKKTLTELAEYIKRNTDPQIYPEVSTSKIENRTIISIKIKEPDEKPVFFKSHAYKRVGNTNQRISSSEIRKLAKESKGKVYWDEQICEETSLKDIDEEKVRWFVKEAKKQRGLNLSESLSIKDILMRLKLSKDGKVTNAAILLFGKYPQKFFSQSEVKCIRFKGNNVTGPMIDMKVIEGHISNQLEKAEDFIFEHIPMAAWIEDLKLQRQEKWLYPPKAIREALVNALVHRDYESPSKTQIRIFDNSIEFWNPGRLPEGWTVETLKQKHESQPFNPLIAKQFFWVKYIEDVGTGTNKIIEWCVDWGLPEPEFEFTGSSIIVIFRKPLAKEELLKLGLNERQLKAVEYVEKKGSITNGEYQEINNVARTTATDDLNDLIQKGVFVRVGKGKRGLKYILVLHQKSAKDVQKEVQKSD